MKCEPESEFDSRRCPFKHFHRSQRWAPPKPRQKECARPSSIPIDMPDTAKLHIQQEPIDIQEPLLPPSERTTPAPLRRNSGSTRDRARAFRAACYLSPSARLLLAFASLSLIVILAYRTFLTSSPSLSPVPTADSGEMTGKRTVGYFVNWYVRSPP